MSRNIDSHIFISSTNSNWYYSKTIVDMSCHNCIALLKNFSKYEQIITV